MTCRPLIFFRPEHACETCEIKIGFNVSLISRQTYKEEDRLALKEGSKIRAKGRLFDSLYLNNVTKVSKYSGIARRAGV